MIDIGKKGFRITYPNGWTASVQIGPGNYCDHYDKSFDKENHGPSLTFEFWSWSEGHKEHWPSDPMGYVDISNLHKLLKNVSKK